MGSPPLGNPLGPLPTKQPLNQQRESDLSPGGGQSRLYSSDRGLQRAQSVQLSTRPLGSRGVQMPWMLSTGLVTVGARLTGEHRNSGGLQGSPLALGTPRAAWASQAQEGRGWPVACLVIRAVGTQACDLAV